MTKGIKLSVLIPVFNEVNTIKTVIDRVKKSGNYHEIIIVDDGSTDGTREVLQKIKDNKIKIVFHKKNKGKGAAIQTALKEVTGEYIIIQDADLEYDPQDFDKLIKPITDGKAEVVYGSRFTGEHRNLLFWHWVCNHVITLFLNVLFNSTISDVETGYKLIKTSIFREITFKSNRFDIEIELTAKILKNHHYIYEVPISYAGRDYAQGKKITAWDGVMAMWSIFRYRFFN